MDVSNRQLDLARREADVAIRTVRPAAAALWGRKIARIAWCIYARREPRGHAAVLDDAIGWDTEGPSLRVARWIEATRRPIRLRTSSLVQQQVAARARLGRAVLPCHLGDADPALLRAAPAPLAELQDELWIVAHAQIRQTARIRAIVDFLASALRKEVSLIEVNNVRTIPHRRLARS